MRALPKKRLGQNFLRDGHARARIVAACDFSPSDIVLEIGPGQGAITPLIAPRVAKVYAVEIDTQLIAGLEEKLRFFPNVAVLNRDILRFDICSIPESASRKIRIFGNIPYYITSPIIEHLFASRAGIADIFLTVQKEFARRICAGPGSKEYGSFSCFVQYYAEPEILFDVKRHSFYPVPKVDSSFIRLRVRESPPVDADEESLFRVIRSAFQQRRKTLRNSLEGLIDDARLDEFFSRRRIDPRIRPEMLSLEDFACLASYVK